MPDVREELGRLAGEAGEPGGLDALAATRRRRERRRRTTSFIGGLAVLLIGAVVVVQLARDGAAPVPGDSSPPAVGTSSSVTTVWPENAVNGDSASAVQEALDGGDHSLRWRTDPAQVVDRFGGAVLGRDMRIVDTEQLDDGVLVYASPCPPGEKPVGDGCDTGEPIAFHVIQPATAGEGGIWSIARVNSMPHLGVTVLGDPVTDEVAEGDDVTFDIGGLPASTSAHLGIVVANGCNVVHAVDDRMTAGPARLSIPSVGDTDPSCASSPGGYAFLYVADDTTLPSTDPIEEPTAIEYPWISIMPFSLVPSGGSASATPPVSPEPGGVPVPVSIPAATAKDCPTVPATEFQMSLINLRLVGCGRWAADAEITIHFRIADSGVPAGLMLFRADECSAGTCTGDPSLNTKVEQDSRSVHFGPVRAGSYILLDPVHPMTSAVAIDIS